MFNCDCWAKARSKTSGLGSTLTSRSAKALVLKSGRSNPPCSLAVAVPGKIKTYAGSGAAGLYAALCLPPNLKVGLITKEDLKTGASDWAQGGIAAATSPQDSPVFHLEDTLKAGAGLCDRYAVQFLVEKATQAIADLVRLGVSFDRSGDDLARTLEAAHSQARVLHAADRTGRAIISTLMEKVTERPNITIIQPTLNKYFSFLSPLFD